MPDRSSTIAAGGTAQVFATAYSGRKGFWIQNLSSGDLWLSDVGTAAATQPSWKVPAGNLYETPPGFEPDGAISIFGATTGQAFAGRDY